MYCIYIDIYVYIYTQSITEHGVLDWAVRRLNCPPRLLAGSPQDASETLKDATNNFILSKATDEDRDVKERFVDQEISEDIQGYPKYEAVSIIVIITPYYTYVLEIQTVLSDSRSASSLESSFVEFLDARVDRMEDQQLQRAHAAAEDLLTESQVSGFASIAGHHRSTSLSEKSFWYVG